MKKHLLSIVALVCYGYAGLGWGGELCERNNIEYVMEEARRDNHAARDVLFEYDYHAKELLAQQPTPAFDQCLKQLLEPIIAAEHLIVSNKEYDKLETCAKYELISINAKAFTKKYSGNPKSYFQACFNMTPSAESKPEATAE